MWITPPIVREGWVCLQCGGRMGWGGGAGAYCVVCPWTLMVPDDGNVTNKEQPNVDHDRERNTTEPKPRPIHPYQEYRGKREVGGQCLHNRRRRGLDPNLRGDEGEVRASPKATTGSGQPLETTNVGRGREMTRADNKLLTLYVYYPPPIYIIIYR